MTLASKGMILAYTDPMVWPDPTKPFDATAFADVEVQLDGTVSGVGFSRCLNGYEAGATWYAVKLVSTDDPVSPASSTTVSAPGIYRLPGGGWLKQTAGSAATTTIVSSRS